MTQARTLNNRYEIQAKIGDGGMAAVYKALDLKLNRIVALKILRDSYSADPQFLVRFKREAEQAAGLNHPNIVRVYDVGDEGDLHYIVMEYIEGSNLKDVIMREAPFSTQRTIEIGTQICDAIAYSHSAGLIHRDIKPQNILMDKAGRVKVVDFGIAKSSNAATLTEAGITLGTVHYFSPEQAKGMPVLPQSDIYSIGVVLFELMTGRIPFDSDNPVALALKHIEEPAPSPRRYNAAIPVAMEQIILKSLSKDPYQRYASADQLSKALRNLENPASNNTQTMPPDMATPRPPVAPSRPTPPQIPVSRPATSAEPGQTMYQPVRPNPARQPQQPRYDGYEAAVPPPLPRSGAPRYYDDRDGPPAYRTDGRSAGATRGRPPVAEVESDYLSEVQGERGGGCLPWFLGGMAFLMVVALVVVLVLVLPQLTKNTPITATPVATLPNSTPVPVQKIVVPNLAGKTQKEAEDALKAAKLQPGEIKQEFSATLDTGRVISTEPKVNASVDVNTKISLTVSKGKETVPLIDYINTPPDATENQLKQLGLVVQRAEDNSPTVQKGAVIKTDPPGGPNVTVAKGSTVKLIISKGPAVVPTPIPVNPPTATPVPEQVQVPGVVGKAQADGFKILQNAGLRVRVEEWDEAIIRTKFSGPALDEALKTYANLKKGDVLGTDPPEGKIVNKGGEILMAIKK